MAKEAPKTETTEISIINFEALDLKKSPFFQEKKKSIKKELAKNKIIEIVDTKTYDQMRESRTNVRTLRTSLEKEKKQVGDQLKVNINDVVATEYDNLIADVKNKENERQQKVTDWENKKAKEKADKEAEELRKQQKIEALINSEKEKLQLIIDEFSEFEAIDETIFNFENTAQIFRDSEKEEGIDVETVNLEFESAFETLSEALQAKIDTITTQYNLDQSNKALEVQKLTNSRMIELFDYDYKYKGEKELGSLSVDEYEQILIPEIERFRIKQMIELGFEKSLIQKDVYFYAPNENILLISYNVELISEWNNAAWITLLGGWKKQIEDYNNPKVEEKIEELVVLEAINEEIEVKEEIELNESFTFSEQNKELIEGNVKYKLVTETDIKIELTAMQLLKKEITDLWSSPSDEPNYSTILKLIEQHEITERANLIEAYNDAKNNTINLLVGDLKEYENEFNVDKLKEMFLSINEMDAVEYVNEKYGI